jgi:hypothetical protein
MLAQQPIAGTKVGAYYCRIVHLQSIRNGVSAFTRNIGNASMKVDVTNQELWIGLVELRILAHADSDLLRGAAGAFTNIVTWASCASEFREKAELLAKHYNLYVQSIEGEESIASRRSRAGISVEVDDLIARAEVNRNAILYGTFHQYLFDEA